MTFADESGEWEVTYLNKEGKFTKYVLTFPSFKLASKWAKAQAKKYVDVTVYRETPSRVYMATWDRQGNRKNPGRGNGGGRVANAANARVVSIYQNSIGSWTVYLKTHGQYTKATTHDT